MATKRPPPDPAKFNEAVEAFRELVPMPFDEFEQLLESEKVWAFRVAHVTQASIVQDVFDALDSAILNGDTFEDFKRLAGPKLTQAWGAPNAPRVETVFRTNVMRAYNEGRDAIMESAPVRKARPYRRFDAIEDGRECKICGSRDGKIYPADHSFWKTSKTPLHHKCRCMHTPLTEEEAKAEGVATDDDFPPPAAGFGGPYKDVFNVDLDRFSPPLRNVLKKRIGKKDAA